MRALLSVHDKSGLVELARGLSELGWELVASGQTAQILQDAGLQPLQVTQVTGSPEMLDGRVKTLHPKVHGGILADRSKRSHLQDLQEQNITPIDLVIANLYPFSSDPSVELIDVGGPAMMRAAAKNFEHVGVVVSPEDYPALLEELRRSGTLSEATRRRLARRAFSHTASYDAAIVQWLDREALQGDAPDALPPTLHLTFERAQSLRYGENPHQQGARYRATSEPSWWDGLVQHGGRELSYLNLFDTDAAWRLVSELRSLSLLAPSFSRHGRDAGGIDAVAIVKHANPCGVAVAGDLATAYRRALECDPLSAFGGIVALSGLVSYEVAEAISEGPQADVIIATDYEPAALTLLSTRRKSTRLLEGPAPEHARRQLRSMGAGLLVQDCDAIDLDLSHWEVMTKASPTDAQWDDLRLAWLVCARTTSNAVVVVNQGQAVGVGAGQQSRVMAAEIAVNKAGTRANGGAAASDAFFPFPDGVEVLARGGVSAIVQPGGSMRDGEVVAAADTAGVTMVATGERHFRH